MYTHKLVDRNKVLRQNKSAAGLREDNITRATSKSVDLTGNGDFLNLAMYLL